MPTPRAISERIARIKQMAKGNGTSAPTTPKKSATPRKRGSTQLTPSARHSSTQITDQTDGDAHDAEKMRVQKEAADIGSSMGAIYETPTKRARTTSVPAPGMVAYEIDDETDRDAKYVSEASDYANDSSIRGGYEEDDDYI